MVYVGDKKIGILPKDVEKSKVYTYDCDAVGDFVKIVTGREDKKLAFANVEVYGTFNNSYITYTTTSEIVSYGKTTTSIKNLECPGDKKECSNLFYLFNG